MGAAAVGGQRDVGVRAVRPGHDLRHDQRCAGWRRAWRDRRPRTTETQQTRTTVTDGSGFYTFPNLQPGRYDVSAELQGFKKETRTGVQVDAASALTLDFALETGALTEEVTVTSEATLLQTDVAVRKTVEAKDIELLSFNGRNPIGVPALKAGVIGGSFNNAGAMSLTAGGFNINGGRSDEAVVYVDGAVATRTRSAGTMIGVQNADTVQEVQVLTANYMPEYGRASGGQIRFISKSGSSRYSGNASFFFRDERCRPTPGRATAARTRPRIPAPRRSTRSSTGTPSAGRSPARCSRTSCSSSARRSGWISSRCRPIPATVPTWRCGREISASCSGRIHSSAALRSSAIRRPGSRSPETSFRRDACLRTGLG